jgi:hypothetical protein
MLGSPRPRRSGPRQTRIAVAAFGKHPAWKDHIDEDVLIAAPTDELALLERWLHGSTFEEFITKSAVHSLSAGNLIPLDHLIVRSLDTGCSLTRVWASTDYSGRAKFPMVLSVDAEGLGIDEAMARVLPALESTAASLREIGDALRKRIDAEDSARAGSIDTAPARQAVREVVENLRRQLGESISAPTDAEPDAAALLRDLRAHSDSGPGAQGLARVMYCLERLKPASSTSSSMTRSGSGKRWRLPRAADNGQDSIRRWLALLAYLAPDAPAITLALPKSHPWTDLFVGDVAVGELERLCLSERAESIESHTAYSAVDAAYIARTEAQLDAWVRSTPPTPAFSSTGGSSGKSASGSTGLGQRFRRWFGGS